MVGQVAAGLILVGLLGPAGQPTWHDSFYLSGGDYWRARLPIIVRNPHDQQASTMRAEVRLQQRGPTEQLVGTPACAIRVCDSRGNELRYSLLDGRGHPVRDRTVPNDSRLGFVVSCAPGETQRYYVYFDNPHARQPPDFLPASVPPAASPAGPILQVEVGQIERRQPERIGPPAADLPWLDGARYRAVVRVVQFENQPARPALASVDLTPLAARLKGRFRETDVVVKRGSETVRHAILGRSLLFEVSRPACSEQHYIVYFSWSERPAWLQPRSRRLRARVLQNANLVRNGSFEDGSTAPAGWQTVGTMDADGSGLAVVRPGKPGAGARCVRLHVPASTPAAWRGWRQRVRVQPGATYLLASWVRCRDVDGAVRIHAHRRTAEGRLAELQPFSSVGDSVQGSCDWTLLSGQFPMGEDTRYFEIHLTMDTHGTVWHDEVLLAEVLPVPIARVESRPLAVDRLAVWPVPSVVKVFPEDLPPQPPNSATIRAARNEWEPLQLAVRAGTDVGRVEVEVEAPTGAEDHTLDDFQVNVVGTVPVDYPTNYYRSERPVWQRMVPDSPPGCDGWAGRWPDPLLPAASWSLRANETRAIWITFRVPPSTPAGEYRGAVRIKQADDLLARVPFRLHVWDFTLPRRSRFAAIYDVRLGPGQSHWGGKLEDKYREIVRFLAQRRLCPDTIRPAPSIRFAAGKVVADFRQYDEAAKWYFEELDLPHAYTPWMFYCFGWGHPPRPFCGEQPYDTEILDNGGDRSRLRPEYKRAYQACLRAYWSHMKEQGWEDRITLYIADEPYDQHSAIRSQMEALCEMIHEVDPEIPIYSSTWKHVPEWNSALDVWGIGHDGRVPVERMAELRRNGERLWFTTDGQMCTDTPYCAIERLLPYYCFKYDVEAYEFWGAGWLTHDPYRFGWHAYIDQSCEPGKRLWIRYPNGDGFLLYPGDPIGYQGIVSSIRLEQAREGVEDHAYLVLLRDRIELARSRGGEIDAATRALTEALELVSVPTPGGRYSTRILSDPSRLYEARGRVAAAIESLGRPCN